MPVKKLVLLQTATETTRPVNRPYKVVEVHNTAAWNIGERLTKDAVRDIIVRQVEVKITQIMIRKIWTLWAKSLGDKSSELDREADAIAAMRTLIVLVNFITCLFIVANIIKNWSQEKAWMLIKNIVH